MAAVGIEDSGVRCESFWFACDLQGVLRTNHASPRGEFPGQPPSVHHLRFFQIAARFPGVSYKSTFHKLSPVSPALPQSFLILALQSPFRSSSCWKCVRNGIQHRIQVGRKGKFGGANAGSDSVVLFPTGSMLQASV